MSWGPHKRGDDSNSFVSLSLSLSVSPIYSSFPFFSHLLLLLLLLFSPDRIIVSTSGKEGGTHLPLLSLSLSLSPEDTEGRENSLWNDVVVVH